MKYQDHIVRVISTVQSLIHADTSQVESQSDAMLDVLKSLPEPSGERQRKDNAVVKIVLENRYTRVGMYCVFTQLMASITKGLAILLDNREC